jgi:hypothetical protein
MPQEAIVVDRPQPGYWKLRLHPGGWHEVPVRIGFSNDVWWAELDGEMQEPATDPIHAEGILDIWHSRKTAISEAEYDFLRLALKSWARLHYPDHPLLDPRKAVITAALRPIPQLTAPPEAEPVSAEPLPENRPRAPAPLSREAIREWLEYEHEALVKAIARDVLALAPDAGVEVNDETTLARISTNVAVARGRLRLAEERRKKAKAPFLDGGRAVDEWFALFMDKAEASVAPLQRAMDTYGARLADEKRTTPEERTADLTRSRTLYGGAVSGTEVFGWEVEDADAVPDAYLTVNGPEVTRAVKAFTRDYPEEARKGISPIPGIRITRTIKMRAR